MPKQQGLFWPAIIPQLAAEESVSYLKKIAQEEDIKINEDAYKAILYISEGDMRKAVNVMQTASIIGKKITEKTIYEATNRADPNAISNMVSKAVKGDFMKARDDLLRLMIDRGLAGEDIIREIHSQVFNLDLDDMKKLRLLEALGDYDYRIVEGSNARIQLEAMLAKFGVIGKE
jgi:replication factor C small subunit